MRHLTTSILAAGIVTVLAGCSTNDPAESAASPVEAVSRSTERVGAGNQSMNSYDRRGEDGTIIAKVVAPAPQVWDALKASFEARNVNLTILDRMAGRLGDTSMVFTHRWAGQNGSYFFQCGQTITGQRADEDRVRAYVLAQMSRLKADTVAIAVHMSGYATSISMGSSAATAQCSSTGRGESDILDDVLRRLGTARR